jgi:hypothetical protein
MHFVGFIPNLANCRSSKDCELFWSTEALQNIKFQAPNRGSAQRVGTPKEKLQTNLKFQYSMTKTGLEFGILVIVICPSTWLRVVSLSNHLIFDICDLEFLILYYSKSLSS